MVLVDTSAWIITGGTLDGLLRHVAEEEIATCPPIVQELLQGTGGRDDYDLTREMLLGMSVLDAPVPLVRYEEAARLYLQCRDAGFTIRKAVDLLIAASAIAHRVTVLHRDRDFDYLAQVTGLQAIRI